MMRLRGNRRWLLLVVGVALVAAYLVYFVSLPPPNTNPEVQNLSVAEAKAKIDTTPTLVILDVRTVAEYATGHIEGAVNIPVEALASRIAELDPYRATLVYCSSGNRSAQAAQFLVEQGFTPVYNMLDGLLDWTAQGYPTTT